MQTPSLGLLESSQALVADLSIWDFHSCSASEYLILNFDEIIDIEWVYLLKFHSISFVCDDRRFVK